MFKGNKISLVIPALNEEESIGLVLSNIPNVIDEIIVIDNGSTDKTANICRYLGARVISEKHRGYGAALKTGILSAKGDIVICMDGDNSYPLSIIEEFLEYMIANKYDFISGQRILYKHKNAMPLINKISNAIISWLIRSFFKIKLKDSQSGMWVFRQKIIYKIMPFSSGMGFSQEIKLRAWLMPDIKCGEIQIPYDKRLGGTSKFNRLRDGLMLLYEFLMIFGEYHGFIQYKKNNF